MVRTAALVLAVLASAPLAQKLHQLVEPAAPAQAAPEMLGKDKPVFLGRMAVEATALPQDAGAQ